jgi:hypothetical protein
MIDSTIRARLNILQARYQDVLDGLDHLIAEVEEHNDTAERPLHVEVLVDSVLARLCYADE